MRLRHFYKINHKKEPIPGSNIKAKSRPKPYSQWKEIFDPCCTDVDDIECTCGFRFFVQLDGLGKPVPSTLIKREKWPQMAQGIRYQEIQWDWCCPPIPGLFHIDGYGGSEGSICTGDSADFWMDTLVMGIGTALYLSDRITPVNFELFRDDATGTVWQLTNGIVTGSTELTCSFNYQVSNVQIGDAEITAITEDDVPLIFIGGVDFPIAASDTGQFSSNVFTPGLRTIKVTIVGDNAIATQVTITDSATTLHVLPFTGDGVYTFPNVFISGPNVDTFGIGISLE